VMHWMRFLGSGF